MPLRATAPLKLPLTSPHLLANRGFLLLWTGQATSQVGDRVQQIAVLWWALKLHDQLADAGWMMVATTLPLVLFSPLGGAVADRFDRRSIMLACDLGRALIAGAVATLAFKGELSLPILLGASFTMAALTALFLPAAMAIVVDLVNEKDLVRAGSLQELTVQLATILGPSLGGVLVAGMGSPLAFAVNASSFLVSAAALIALRPPASTPNLPNSRSWRRDLVDGVLVAREFPKIGVLLVAFGLANFFSSPLLLFLPRYADLFGVGARGLGFLEASLAGGVLLASVLLLRSPTFRHPPWLYPACLAAIGTVMVGLGFFGDYSRFLLGLGAIGIALGVLNVTVVAYFQQGVPPDRLGRFMGLLTATVYAAPSIGFGLLGVIANTADPSLYLAACGLGVLLVAGALAATLSRIENPPA